jgi:hypothetical protein
MIDGRNDNRGVNADGRYDQTRDWFYQNVRLKDRWLRKAMRSITSGALVSTATTWAVRCCRR